MFCILTQLTTEDLNLNLKGKKYIFRLLVGFVGLYATPSFLVKVHGFVFEMPKTLRKLSEIE